LNFKVYTVGELTRQIKDLIEESFPPLWVEGEISNFVHHGSGHMYFSLKDQEAVLRAVFFRQYNSRLLFRPENGMQVLARGTLTVYEPSGQYQLVVSELRPSGTGALQLAFEQLKARLEARGFFDEERKRPVPSFPEVVGVVTSPTGAAVRDIISVIARRCPPIEIVLYPVRVQGEGAAAEIAEGIRAFGRWGGADVLIVARGGGSLEDLWAFNEEPVARAIFASRLPVVSGVGHETDTTIADYVADVRAPTPSAAAELIAPERTEVSVRLSVAAGTLLSCVRRLVDDGRAGVQHAAVQIDRAVPDINRERQRTDDLTRDAVAVVEQQVRGYQKTLHGFSLALRSLDPYAVLQRGYALVQRDGHVIENVADVSVGERLNVRVRDGDFPVRVDSGQVVPDRARRRKAAAVAKEQAHLFTMEE